MKNSENEKVVSKWHNLIIEECQKRLGRRLTEDEEIFITPQREFIALEMIEDTVKTLVGEDLENYLHSEPEK
jgi:hypothetical protein